MFLNKQALYLFDVFAEAGLAFKVNVSAIWKPDCTKNSNRFCRF